MNLPSAAIRHAASVALVAALASIGSGSAQAEVFEFDKRQTEIRFHYQMGISTGSGRFGQVTGTLAFNEGNLNDSKIVASVATTGLATGEPWIDDELKGTDFFNAAVNPAMTFQSRHVVSTGPDSAKMAGDLTINGITRPITFNVALHPHVDPSLKFSVGMREFVATARLQRSAFNMTAYQSMVGDTVDLEIVAVVRKKAAGQ